MNILSISQVQNNAQSDLTQTIPVQSQKTSESDKSSFADFLNIARRESSAETEKPAERTETAKTEKTEEKNPVESEKVAKNDEKDDSSKVSEKKDEKTGDKNKKSEKVTQKKTSDEEKDGEKLKKIADSGEKNENISVQDLMLIENAKVRNMTEENAAEIAVNETPELAENHEIDDKMLAWLVSSTKDVENEDMSSEDFAAMIDAAVEFIPGAETEEEKLESAQHLAVNDPELFLNTVAASDAENFARGAVKSELALGEKKIEPSKEKKGDAKISVHDMRTHRLLDEDSAKVASDKIVQKAAEKKEINLSMQRQADGNMQMTMELAAKAEQNITSTSNQAAGANGSTFQSMLTNAVQENAPDFVKAGNIVLKDNNQGSINLILRPEGLGNVKISLNLDDKNLSAQILVHTKEAMEAFKESIPALKQAFTESGFETGSFDLNFSNNSNQQGFAQGENQNQQNAGILAHKTYGDFVTPSALAAEAADAYNNTPYGINIVA